MNYTNSPFQKLYVLPHFLVLLLISILTVLASFLILINFNYNYPYCVLYYMITDFYLLYNLHYCNFLDKKILNIVQFIIYNNISGKSCLFLFFTLNHRQSVQGYCPKQILYFLQFCIIKSGLHSQQIQLIQMHKHNKIALQKILQ